MPRMIIAFECDWQPRKIATVQAGLQRMFGQIGGVSNLSELRIVSADDAEQEQEPKQPAQMMQLVCRQYSVKTKEVCNARWESEFMTPCPKCNGRAFVKKVQPEENEPPPPAQPAATTTDSSVTPSA